MRYVVKPLHREYETIQQHKLTDEHGNVFFWTIGKTRTVWDGGSNNRPIIIERVIQLNEDDPQESIDKIMRLAALI